MKKIALLMLFVFAGLEAFAQDMIIYKDKTIDEVTIVEVTPDYVKYREYGAPINSVTWNSHHSSVFISCATEYCVYIWHKDYKEPLMMYDLGSQVGDVAWA